MFYVNEVKVNQWTEIALNCLKRNCHCKGCFYNDFFKRSVSEGANYKCNMKQSVLKLVRKYGMPEDIQFKNFIDEKGVIWFI